MDLRAALARTRSRSAAFHDLGNVFGLVAKVLWVEITAGNLELHDVVRFEGEEVLSDSFVFYVTVRIDADKKLPEDLVGEKVSIAFLGAKGNPPKPDKPERYFHGMIAKVTERMQPVEDKNDTGMRYKVLNLEVRPHFWFLKKTQNSRYFQEKSVIEIVEEILKKDHKINDLDSKKPTMGKQKRTFCVQYKESDFAFVSRLLEEEGIGYYFTYDKTAHKMVLFDKNASGEQAKQSFVYKESSCAQQTDKNTLWSLERHTKGVTASVDIRDYDFQEPKKSLFSTVTSKVKSKLKLKTYLPACLSRKKDAKDKLDGGDTLAANRLEAIEWDGLLVEGHSTIWEASPGILIKTEKCADKTLNGDYLVTRVQHSYGVVGNDVIQGNVFEAIPKKVPYRVPLRHMRPRVEGPQTATVTGKSGEEIWCDELGRIKIKFHWDTRKEKDETTSCWVRVLTSLAGKGWGTLTLPRVGQEVLVHFEEGDIERPLVVGCLYNADNVPPYNDKEKEKSTFKSHSTKGGGDDNFNEFRFNDKKGEEEVFLQAEKDAVTLIKDKKTVTIQKGNFELTLESGDRKTTLKGDKGGSEGKGHDSLTLLKGNRTINLKEGNTETTLDKGSDTLTIKKGSQTVKIDEGDQTITIGKGSRKVTIKKDDTLSIDGKWTVTVKGDLSFKGSKNISFEASKDMNIKCAALNIEASKGISAKAGTSLDLKAGTNANIKGSAGVAVKGATISLN